MSASIPDEQCRTIYRYQSSFQTDMQVERVVTCKWKRQAESVLKNSKTLKGVFTFE